MTNVYKLSILQLASIGFALYITFLGQAACASSDHLNALEAGVSLLTKSTFVRGEPIILRYAVLDGAAWLASAWQSCGGTAYRLVIQAH